LVLATATFDLSTPKRRCQLITHAVWNISTECEVSMTFLSVLKRPNGHMQKTCITNYWVLTYFTWLQYSIL